MKNKTIVVVLAVMAALCLALCACATEPTKYDIRFVNDDGTELATVSVEENGKVAYGGKTPAKASTAEFEYTFAGWTDENGVALTELPAATANATYKARYTSAKRSYAVRFVNGETELQNETLAYGAAISYKGAMPEKAATAAESYTFVGWATAADGKAVDIANATVTGEVTYYAVFSGTAVMYDVTWNVSGVETKSQVAYNGAPVYDKATPTKAATDIARYEFAGWAKTENGKVVTIADEKVVADVTYYAVFTEVRTHFAVKFVSGSKELQNSLVASGAAPVYGGATPEKAMTEAEVYTFKGWAKSADSTEVVDLAKESITADGIVYYAVFTANTRMYKVYWKIDGKTEQTEVAYNAAPAHADPTKAATDIARYEFAGWAKTENGAVVDLSSEKITAEATTYYAVFTEVRTHFAVKFVSGSTELQNSLVASGAAPVFGGETPEKASDDTYNYTFKGWAKSADSTEVVDLAKESITADGVVYYAAFTATPREFTVTWHVKGTTSTSKVMYNQAPVYDGEAVGNYSDEDYNYTFEGWSLTDGGDVVALDSVAITANTDIYAKFTAQIKQYTLTIKYVVDGSDEGIADKTLLLDKYTVYGKDTAIGETTTITAEKDGYLPDKMWVSGRLTENTIVTVTYKAADKWDGTVATAYESGTGTAEDPYIIRTGAQLAYLSQQSKGATFGSGLYFKLGASIDLSAHEWTPICNRGNLTSSSGWKFFAGNFDGNGYTIKLSITSGVGVGLFEGISGTVSNLVLTGSVNGTHRAGALAYTISKAKISNVANYATVVVAKDSKEASYSGGIIGISASATLSGLVNYGDMTGGGQFVGGVLGYDVSGTLDGCVNYGAVNGGKYTGGVLGQANTKGKTVATVVKNSANYGTISSTDNGVGGVVGGCTGIMTVENSNNYGVVSTTASSYVGGIVGHGTTVTVKGCDNYGDIECGGNTKGQAGIVGWGVSGSAISNSNNYGDIAGVSNVGGIAGGISADTTITDCVNFGKPTGKNTVGDIFGYQAK